ncbi:MAG: hypothetical protein DHS80DRAFT_24160 [Piptocephalis tieghemiana]|nr:MAG: hypothetical protein DHS80DRAFT_24160 [Piptocephalis tieghemiana]
MGKRSLFVKEDKSPMTFYLTASACTEANRKNICTAHLVSYVHVDSKPIQPSSFPSPSQYNGGELRDCPEDADVRLGTREETRSREAEYSSTWITHCKRRNRLLPLTGYALSDPSPLNVRNKNRNSDNDNDNKSNSNNKSSPYAIRGVPLVEEYPHLLLEIDNSALKHTLPLVDYDMTLEGKKRKVKEEKDTEAPSSSTWDSSGSQVGRSCSLSPKIPPSGAVRSSSPLNSSPLESLSLPTTQTPSTGGSAATSQGKDAKKDSPQRPNEKAHQGGNAVRKSPSTDKALAQSFENEEELRGGVHSDEQGNNGLESHAYSQDSSDTSLFVPSPSISSQGDPPPLSSWSTATEYLRRSKGAQVPLESESGVQMPQGIMEGIKDSLGSHEHEEEGIDPTSPTKLMDTSTMEREKIMDQILRVIPAVPQAYLKSSDLQSNEMEEEEEEEEEEEHVFSDGDWVCDIRGDVDPVRSKNKKRGPGEMSDPTSKSKKGKGASLKRGAENAEIPDKVDDSSSSPLKKRKCSITESTEREVRNKMTEDEVRKEVDEASLPSAHGPGDMRGGMEEVNMPPMEESLIPEDQMYNRPLEMFSMEEERSEGPATAWSSVLEERLGIIEREEGEEELRWPTTLDGKSNGMSGDHEDPLPPPLIPASETSVAPKEEEEKWEELVSLKEVIRRMGYAKDDQFRECLRRVVQERKQAKLDGPSSQESLLNDDPIINKSKPSKKMELQAINKNLIPVHGPRTKEKGSSGPEEYGVVGQEERSLCKAEINKSLNPTTNPKMKRVNDKVRRIKKVSESKRSNQSKSVEEDTCTLSPDSESDNLIASPIGLNFLRSVLYLTQKTGIPAPEVILALQSLSGDWKATEAWLSASMETDTLGSSEREIPEPWSKREDEALLQLVESTGGACSSNEINTPNESVQIEGRSKEDCARRREYLGILAEEEERERGKGKGRF